jgi:hypothetical protein
MPAISTGEEDLDGIDSAMRGSASRQGCDAMRDEGTARTEVEQLVWSLLDGVATSEQIARLEGSLKDDRQAREIYARCVHLHADLHHFFSGEKEASSEKMTPPALPLP